MLSISTILLAALLIATASGQPPQPLSFSSVCQSGIREDNTNYIYCARRSLTDIPLFAKNNVVYDELVLSDNRIAALTATSFARIKVKKIFLNGNPVRRVDPLTFAKLENHLEELWLDAAPSAANSQESVYDDPSSTATDTAVSATADQDEGLPKAIINYLRNLNTLKLKNFVVKQLDNYLFKRLNRIEVLSLQFCSIERIEPYAFDSGLRATLKELHLDGNRLQTVPGAALLTAQFKQLRVLSLAQNLIKTISIDHFMVLDTELLLASPATTLSKLAKLDLSYNGLKQIDARALAPFNATLDTLLLQNNELNSYQLRFVHALSHLRELNLDFNLITRLGTGLFTNSIELQLLSMQGNSIQFDDENNNNNNNEDMSETFRGLVNLQRLNLARNGIKSLGRTGLFQPMRQLKSLSLDKNQLQLDALHELTFNGLYQSLVNITLQSTRMRSLDALKRFERLERVKLGFNELHSIDLSLLTASGHTLSNLDVQSNQITSIELATLDNLTEFDLSNNRLCTFNSAARLATTLPRLKSLGLGQNPLVCDCHLLSLHEWARARLDKDAFGYLQWQCEASAGRRVKFTSLTTADFSCSEHGSKCDQVSAGSTLKPRGSTYEPVGTTTAAFVATRAVGGGQKSSSQLTSFEMRSNQRSILISWTMDTDASGAAVDIAGFKLNYNKKLMPGSGNASATASTKTFLIDRAERKFRLENLESSTVFTICLSVMHGGSGLSSGSYDKYCKDVLIPEELSETTDNDQYDQSDEIVVKKQGSDGARNVSASLVVAPTHQPSSPSAPSDYILLSQSGQASNGGGQSTVLSTLVVSLLIVLLFFVCALIAFVYVYVKKRRVSQKKLKNTSGQSITLSGSGGSLGSRKNYLSGTAILYPAHHNLLTTTAAATIDPRKIIIAANGNHHHHHHHHLLNGAAKLLPCDNSTVSSTLSADNQNDLSPSGGCGVNNQASTTPTSFTHYIVQQQPQGGQIVMNDQQQQQQQQQHYIAYDYNLGALIIPTSSLYHPQHPQHQLTFLNSNKQLFNMNGGVVNNNNNNGSSNNTNNNSNNSDHVYCEIPSTLSRSYRNGQDLTLGNNNNNNNNNNSHLMLLNNNSTNNGDVMMMHGGSGNTIGGRHLLLNHGQYLNSHHQATLHHQHHQQLQQQQNVVRGGNVSNGSNQQNSSSSLLLSTTSSSSNASSNSSSPQASSVQSNGTAHTKYTNASII